MLKSFFIFLLLNMILVAIAISFYELQATCCFDVHTEFRRYLILFIMYGMSDFISLFVSLKLCVKNCKKSLFWIFTIILIVINLNRLINNDLTGLDNLSLYLVIIRRL